VFYGFAAFFAMIVADAGYALVLAGIVLACWRTMGGSGASRRWRFLLSVLAAATVAYGVLAGSYFGVSPPPDSLLGRLHVLDLGNFTVMMALSIIVGALHLAYACVRDGRRYCDRLQGLASFGWAGVILGGLAVWGGMQMESPTLRQAGWGLFGLALVLVIGFSGYGQKPLMRIVSGASALAGLSGAFGDVLSYLRLFALGLASASLAVAFNEMAGNVRAAVPGIGFLFALLILLLGHSLNFLLSLSSGFIHGLRLNVIEFFKWGVKDEGTPFRPFQRKESASWTTSS
jgi:V/A-type H+-transporting ATPase subunit I